MRDNWTRNESNARSGGRWPMGRTSQRSPKLNYPKLSLDDLAEIARLTNLWPDRPRTWYFRPRTQKVARVIFHDPDATHESLEARISSALDGSRYVLLGVSRSYSYGWPWTIEVVAAR